MKMNIFLGLLACIVAAAAASILLSPIPTRTLLFAALMFVSIGAVALFGDRYQKAAITILVSAYVATSIIYNFGVQDWLAPQLSILMVDTVVLFVLLYIMVQVPRWWTFPLVAAHFITLAALGMPQLIPIDITSWSVGVAQATASWSQMTILCAAALVNRYQTNRMSDFSLN